MDKDSDVNIANIVDSLKKEEPKPQENEFDSKFADEPRFISNRTEKGLLIASTIVFAISIVIFLSPRGLYLSKADFNSLIKRVDRIEERLAKIETRPTYHVVERDDTLGLIAQKYGLTVDELLDLNAMTPGQSIHPGQKLIVPAVKGP